MIKKIDGYANYLDEINPKEKAWCQKLLNELDTKRTVPWDMQEKMRTHILDECKLHNTSPEDILESYASFELRLEAKPKITSYDLPETNRDVEETNTIDI